MDNTQNPQPGPDEHAKCATLVAKVIIHEDHVYSQEEIDLARHLSEFEWNRNVTDFLDVVAGIQQPGEWVPEARAALVFQYGEP